MVTEEEYRALETAYQRLHNDYRELEEEKEIVKLRQMCGDLKGKLAAEESDRCRELEELRERQQILDRMLTERDQYIEQMESKLAEYGANIEKYEYNMNGLRQHGENLQKKITELEQWTGHLQSLCDERLERIEQLEYYVHHPFFSLHHLFQIWKKRWDGD